MTKAGWAFAPSAVTTSGYFNQYNFDASPASPTTTISGNVKTRDGVVISGATLTMTGSSATQTTTSDAAGNYSFTANTLGTYTIKAAKAGYDFIPVNKTFTDFVTPQTANFKGSLIQQANTPPTGNTLFSQNVNYAYKKSGALDSIGTSMIGGDALNKTNVIDSLSYRAFGSAKQVVYGNDRKLDLTYTAGLNRLTSMTATRWDGSDKMIDHTYTYADNGLISRTDDAMDTVFTRGYDYNYRNQLKTVYGYNYSQAGYSFDNFGNMTNGMTFPKIGTSDTPVNNRPNSFNNGSATINFTYDNSGNMTAAGATTYQWDGANRLKSVNNGTSGSYGFDGNGKRVKKTESGASTYYVYSTVIGDAVMEVNSSGLQRAYVSGGRGKMIAQRNPDGQFYWLHKDHLGSGRKMTNTSGNLTYRAEFDPYGKLIYEWSATPNLNTRKFTGYERDAGAGLDYAQARMYGSEWGRFLSPDPAGFKSSRLTSPVSFNLYAYTEGNPVNFIDPMGLSLWSWLGDHVFEPLGHFFSGVWDWIGSHIGGGGYGGGGGIGGGGSGGGSGGGMGGNDEVGGIPFIILPPPPPQEPERNDCIRFVAMVKSIAAQATGHENFMDRLALTFAGARDSTIAAMREAGYGVFTGLLMNDSGFKTQYKQAGGNQPRHFVGGLVVGYRLGALLGGPYMDQREIGDSFADLLINHVSVPMGDSQIKPREPVTTFNPTVGTTVTIPGSKGYIDNIAGKIQSAICE